MTIVDDEEPPPPPPPHANSAMMATPHNRRDHSFSADVSMPMPPADRMRSIAVVPSNQPRPTNGIFVAMTVMNWMFASSGRLAMWTTAFATC